VPDCGVGRTDSSGKWRGPGPSQLFRESPRRHATSVDPPGGRSVWPRPSDQVVPRTPSPRSAPMPAGSTGTTTRRTDREFVASVRTAVGLAALCRRDASSHQMERTPTADSDHLDQLYRAAWALCGSRGDARISSRTTRVCSPPAPAPQRGRPRLSPTLRQTFLNETDRGHGGSVPSRSRRSRPRCDPRASRTPRSNCRACDRRLPVTGVLAGVDVRPLYGGGTRCASARAVMSPSPRANRWCAGRGGGLSHAPIGPGVHLSDSTFSPDEV
jgi:hypothetical protein